MFPLVDRDGLTKPVIQIIGEEAIDSGIEEICIITQPGEETLYREYFRRLDDDMVKAFRGKDWAILESEKLRRLRRAAALRRAAHARRLRPRRLPGEEVRRRRAVPAAARRPRLHQRHQGPLRPPAHARSSSSTCSTPSPACSRRSSAQLHLFGTIRGEPIDANKGIYKAELIIEKPSIEVAREQLVTPGLPAGNYLSHFGMHVFSPRIFDSLEHLIKNDLREKGEIQLTAAQEHLRQQSDGKYWVVVTQGQRYDTGIPYGLMETQLALALNGVHRTEICEAIARILAMQVKS